MAEFTEGKDYVTDSQGRAVIRVARKDVSKYLAAPAMYEALKVARLEIEYLHDKFVKTGTGEKVLSQINQALTLAKGK